MNKKVFIILSTMLLIAGLTAYSCKDELNEELTGSIVGTIADKTTGERSDCKRNFGAGWKIGHYGQ